MSTGYEELVYDVEKKAACHINSSRALKFATPPENVFELERGTLNSKFKRNS